MDEVKKVKEWYDEHSETEWNRLEGFHFEFEITKIMLQRHIKPGKILDIGGGTGRYSLYLASLGYEVTLVDLSDGNVAFARKKAKELNLNITIFQGDARDLSKLPLETYDNILVMGPLYHLFSKKNRIKCIVEAKKYLKKDGVLFASFISLAGGLLYYLDNCPEEIIHETALDLFDCMEQDKSWSGRAFTEATFIEIDEIEPFFRQLGFSKITIFGQEGVTGPRLRMLQLASEEVRNFYLNLSVKLCEKKKYFPYSNHIMYIGKI
ncbi:MAG: class I SAM-dependent methyltransferase [Firmicutes bacterium]|nr:class I SAM-dependent methyltransferase [Bacillota bacterium]